MKVQTGTQAAKQQTDQVSNSINSFFTPALLAFAGAAVLVGAFVIFNTFSITVAQRMREFAMLRTIGAMRRQVLADRPRRGAGGGGVASVLGLVAGVGFAKLLGALFKAVGFGLPLAGIHVHLWPGVALPLIVGIGVTLAASVAPASRATRVPPIAALREGAVLPPSRVRPLHAVHRRPRCSAGHPGRLPGRHQQRRRPHSAWSSSPPARSCPSSAWRWLSRYLIRPLARVIGWPLGLRRRRIGPAGAREHHAQHGRTAVTAAALMIGIGLVVFFSVLINGFKQSFLGSIDKSVRRT